MVASYVAIKFFAWLTITFVYVIWGSRKTTGYGSLRPLFIFHLGHTRPLQLRDCAFSRGLLYFANLGNVKVAGIFQRLSKSGESCTKNQCFDKEIRDMAEIAQSLLVLRDHKVPEEGSQSRVIVGSIVLQKILELVNDANWGIISTTTKACLEHECPSRNWRRPTKQRRAYLKAVQSTPYVC